jgi:hypothetical protein
MTHRDAGGRQDAVDHVCFFGPGGGLYRQCLRDGMKLIAFFAFQHRALELLFRSHRPPRFECPRWEDGSKPSSRESGAGS